MSFQNRQPVGDLLAYRPTNSCKGQLVLQRLKSDLRRSVNERDLDKHSEEHLRCLRAQAAEEDLTTAWVVECGVKGIGH